jgi:hypothetical protein
LAEKEKELDELRLVIKGGQGKEYNSDALQKIEELNKQLEVLYIYIFLHNMLSLTRSIYMKKKKKSFKKRPMKIA